MTTKKHILVLYVHSPSRLAHLKKLRSLKDRYLITILHANVPQAGYIEHFCHHAIACAVDNTDSSFQDILSKCAAIAPPDGIINLSEPFLPQQARLCAHFNLLGPSAEAVRVGRNKYNMRDFAKELEIPVPRYCQVRSTTLEQARALHYPVIVKPVVGSGSTLVKRIESFEELQAQYEELSNHARAVYRKDSQFQETFDKDYPYIVEEIIGGDVLFKTALPVTVGEISVESVFCNDAVHVLAIHDKPLPNNGPYFEEVGYSTPSRMPDQLQFQAKEYVSRIHRALGPGTYVLHTEFRTLASGLILLEFGVRMGGAAIYNSLLASTGVDFIQVQIDIVLDEFTHQAGPAIPTITQFLFPARQGKILFFAGESKLVAEPTYVEHQIYDDIGDVALRAPLASRSTMHVLFQDDDFDHLETRVLKAVGDFQIVTE